MVNEKTSGQKKLIVILIVTTVFAFISSYAVNKLYTFSCFSLNDRRAIWACVSLIDIAYSFTAAKLSGVTFEEMGIVPQMFRKYLFMLIPGVLIQLLRICLGICTPVIGVVYLFLYLLAVSSEEILFRGLVLGLILKISHSNKYAIIIQAVIFGLVHYFHADYGTLMDCTQPMFIGAINACIRLFFPEGMGMPIAILLHWVWDMCIP